MEYNAHCWLIILIKLWEFYLSYGNSKPHIGKYVVGRQAPV